MSRVSAADNHNNLRRKLLQPWSYLMGERPKRSLGQRAVDAACGAFLGGLIGLPAIFWWFEIDWRTVGILAVIGLLLGWFFGDEAIAFLSRLWW
jgi:hypothetical protein